MADNVRILFIKPKAHNPPAETIPPTCLPKGIFLKNLSSWWLRLLPLPKGWLCQKDTKKKN